MKRNRILYLCLLFLSVVFIYFFGGKIPYTLFYLIIAMPLISLLYTIIIYFRLKYVQELDKKFVTKGDHVKFIFSINNEDIFLYPYISVVFYGSRTIFGEQFQERSFAIPPFSKKSFEFEFYCKYRGNYEIGLKSIEIRDFLGIFKLSYKVPEAKVITVYPRVVNLDRFHLYADYSSESHSMLNSGMEDMTNISDLREYFYGDSFKRIHWKLTAKLGSLLVKNYQSTSQNNALLILDLRKSNYKDEENAMIEDKIIETYISVLKYCLSKWVPVSVIYYLDRMVELDAVNPLMFENLYKLLSEVAFSGEVDIAGVLDVYLTGSVKRTNLFVFTCNIGCELYSRMYKAASLGYDAALVYISHEEITGKADDEAERVLSSLPESGISVYRISLNDDTKQVLEAV